MPRRILNVHLNTHNYSPGVRSMFNCLSGQRQNRKRSGTNPGNGTVFCSRVSCLPRYLLGVPWCIIAFCYYAYREWRTGYNDNSTFHRTVFCGRNIHYDIKQIRARLLGQRQVDGIPAFACSCSTLNANEYEKRLRTMKITRSIRAQSQRPPPIGEGPFHIRHAKFSLKMRQVSL